MRVFYLLILILISFQSCSTASNDDMISDEQFEMQMDIDEMPVNASFKGSFVSGDHPTSGSAFINEDSTTLSFKDFSTDDGPLLEVYLATDTSASNYITLGALKGINGDYQYDLPKDVDYRVYDHVLIWCVTFSVNFGHAVLK
ncbi:DM13 domain-containing protein [Thalassobellus sediminis]|uniref:DM13 domain-containing protein n=1 Tax=Thalassobellus sediminis TaxID=3367753 RepID=UPI0037A046F6